MQPINLLIIDDDIEEAKRLMKVLKLDDEKNMIGECVIDSQLLNCTTIEEYDARNYKTKFDAVLIDYQLNKEFTGTLVSAWLMLQLRIPRITLTADAYHDSYEYFNQFIRKSEITNRPKEVIHRIISCVSEFNFSAWLEKKYEELVEQYTAILANNHLDMINNSDQQILDQLSCILDRFERVLDAEQEKAIAEKLQYISSSKEHIERESEIQKRLDITNKKIAEIMNRLGESYE